MLNKKALLAALRHKEADLDMLDTQIMGLPDSSPQFDTLAQKREEMEKEILKIQEGVSLVEAWDNFKSEGGWSDDVKKKLDNIDPEVVAVVDGDQGLDPMGGGGGFDAPLDLGAPALPPAPPVDAAPAVPAIDSAPPVDTPPVDDTPADDGLGEDIFADAPPAPNDNVVASKKNSNYATPNKKASPSLKGNSPMATPGSSLKERIATIRQKRAEAIKTEAQTRVASAWTIAKTLMPAAPASAQESFALTLLANSTKVLKAALRQTAKNAAFQKVCEALSSIHKVEMNDLMEDPSVLTKAEREVSSEIKGEAKNAAPKKADDRTESGPLPAEYPEPKRKEPTDIDAGKAGDRTADTVNKSEGGKEASKKKACSKKCTGKGDCVGCKLAAMEAKLAAAKAKFADDETNEAPAPVPEAAPAPEIGAEDDAPIGDEPIGDEAPTDDLQADEHTEELNETIDNLESDIAELRDKVNEEGESELDLTPISEGGEEEIPAGEGDEGGELDLGSIFDNDNLDEKISALANEDEDGDSHFAADEDFFGPSTASEMESGLENDGMHHASDDIAGFFDMQGSDADSLSFLLTSSAKTADEDIVKPGDIADMFETDAVDGDDRDEESDHDGNLFYDILDSLKPEEYDSERDQSAELEPPPTGKAASKKASTPTRLKVATGAPAGPSLGELLLNNDDY